MARNDLNRTAAELATMVARNQKARQARAAAKAAKIEREALISRLLADA